MIRAISATVPACYGVGACPHHATCQRYAAVETTSPDHTVATCADGAGGWPLFTVPVWVRPYVAALQVAGQDPHEAAP